MQIYTEGSYLAADGCYTSKRAELEVIYEAIVTAVYCGNSRVNIFSILFHNNFFYNTFPGVGQIQLKTDCQNAIRYFTDFE